MFINELHAAAYARHTYNKTDLRVSVQLVCCNASMHVVTLIKPFLNILLTCVQTG